MLLDIKQRGIPLTGVKQNPHDDEEYSGIELWWAIYGIWIGHVRDTYDYLYIYIIFTMTDICGYGCVLQELIHITFSFFQQNKIIIIIIICNVCVWICLILFESVYVMPLLDAYHVYAMHMLLATVHFPTLF